MPTINKIQKKPKPAERKETDMRELRRKAYNNTQWRKMRDTYLHEHPICEECLKKGKVTAAEDVHHKRSPFRKGEINYGLLMDYDNLEAVCKICHATIHNNQNGIKTQEQIIEDLDNLMKNCINNDDE